MLLGRPCAFAWYVLVYIVNLWVKVDTERIREWEGDREKKLEEAEQ